VSKDYEALAKVLGHARAMQLLEALASDGPTNFTSLVESLSTSTDVVSRHLKSLVEYGLVVRNERDGREVEYRLTEKGEQAYQHIQKLCEVVSSEDGPTC